MTKKRSTGQRNFYRFVTLIAVVAIWFFVTQFLGAAPKLNNSPYHAASTPVSECLNCHVNKVEKTPIMPHRPMESCTFCHKPQGR